MAIDSHMHANNLVVSDLSKVISHINDNPNIESVINVGLNIETSKQSIDISRNNKKFYSAIGIHPLYIGDQDIKSLYTLAQEDKVVAIGEIGIDTINEESITEQKKYLIQQIRIANELGLPVIIHANNANKQIIKIFENKELRSLFTTDEQEKMLTIIRKETTKYIDEQTNKIVSNGYETSSYESEASSFTMK